MRRRDVLAGISGITAAAFAGCLGAVGMATHEATPAGVDASVTAETGYEAIGIEELVVEREFEQAGYSERISVTNYMTEYEKPVDLGPLGSQRAAVFTVLTTPQISIAGRELNPIEGMDSQELVELVADNYDDIGSVEVDRENTVSILDQETLETRFSADARFDGHDVPVYLHISESVQTADDHLVTVGVYPEAVADQEEQNILSMMEAAIEDTDDEASGDDASGHDDDAETDDSDGDGSNGANGSDGDNGSNDEDESDGDEDDSLL